ncbi:MoaD/ThiS family protein [Tessaracoccus sp. OH4464_COT-324]|uniref:MoaD/ThiS family protein n=1 Tax=Tessaracoccus sp. OH4464_COT-324 TaxID=2491059 RepID=UPI000F63730C|nr:MoaD/ThiS family protein [Tessaracoccus sp. OH4464_COT-324]RRD46625.1 MoaD/ThiS family protein [Tessaracoccus sp. OH4464_COT-324]
MEVRFFAGAAEAAGVERRQVPDGLGYEQLLAHLGSGNEHLARVLQVCSFLADGRRITGERDSLVGVAQVDVLPPFAGG